MCFDQILKFVFSGGVLPHPDTAKIREGTLSLGRGRMVIGPVPDKQKPDFSRAFEAM